MARIEVEIEEYLDEVRTEILFRELKKRKDFKELIENEMDEVTPKYIIPDFKIPEEVLAFLRLVLRLKPWHDKERIISEIKSL